MFCAILQKTFFLCVFKKKKKKNWFKKLPEYIVNTKNLQILKLRSDFDLVVFIIDCVVSGIVSQLFKLWFGDVFQIVQVSCHLYPPLRLWNMYPACWLWEKRIDDLEAECLRKFLRISYSEHQTNDWMTSTINFHVGPQEPLLATVKRRKLARLGHVTHQDSLSKSIGQGTELNWTELTGGLCFNGMCDSSWGDPVRIYIYIYIFFLHLTLYAFVSVWL